MNIFQKSVLQKHLKSLDKEMVEKAFDRFRENYSAEKIKKIKSLKEEEYQDGFLRDLFVNVLGYTLKPDDNFNLVREQKNQSDGKKADGAILNGEKVVAVIELKSTSTKDLTSVAQQAFNYKNNQPGCKYVITSNFQKLRFYIENSADYEPFDLFELNGEEFAKLYLLLSKDSILNDLPEKIKQESIFHEEEVTKKLYDDYQAFKDRIFDNLVKGNPQYDKLTLFKKAQKLLDRILFILFAEDKGLIPPNTIKQIISDWDAVCKRNRYEPLYNFFKDYFGYIDTGFVIADFGEIPAYNGGLFGKDEILDHPDLKLPDGLLLNYTPVLSKYDFNSEVDVNILGHIFEHSLSEIEELTAEIQGQPTDNTKTKRKKDGIFYTPKYITKYIVENTVGALCTEQKAKLKINELLIDDTYHNENGTLNHKANELIETLRSYKNWLLTLKILDPACGSGAFLNQALDFLIAEHFYIDELIESVSGVKTESGNNDKAILENNIYGVDINEESIEIAKLSLWLRTAKRGRALSDLSGNIKCGNSLIDDPEVAGEKAFDWHKEFPHVFNPEIKEKVYQKLPESKPDYLSLIEKNAKLAEQKAAQSAELSKEAILYSKKVYEYAQLQKSIANEPEAPYGINKGGFDVVIGNPPYGAYIVDLHKNYYKSKYTTFQGNYEIYFFFIEKVNYLLNQFGMLGFITPDTWINIPQAQKLRVHVLSEYSISTIINFEYPVFIDAAVNPIVFILSKNGNSLICNVNTIFAENNTSNLYNKNSYTTCLISHWEKSEDNQFQIFQNQREIEIISKMKLNSIEAGNILDVSQGIVSYSTEHLSVTDIENRIYHSKEKLRENYGMWVQGRAIKRYSLNTLNHEFLNYGKWLHRPRMPMYFNNDRILIQEITGGNPPRISATYYSDLLYHDPGIISCLNKSNINTKFILAIVNSTLISWFNRLSSPKGKRNTFPKVLIGDIRKLPIKNTEIIEPFIERAELMLSLNKTLQTEKNNFISSLKEDKGVGNITRVLENFNEIEYDAFKKELLKQKVKISLGSENNEWRDYFNATKQKVNELQAQINQTDKEIDKMVYDLYELTPEEIKIVEKSVK